MRMLCLQAHLQIKLTVYLVWKGNMPMKTFSQLHISLRIRMYLQFITSLTSSAIIPYISVYFSSLIGTTVTGVIVIIVILSGIVGALIGGYLADRIGRRKMMIIAEAGIGITYLLLQSLIHHGLIYHI